MPRPLIAGNWKMNGLQDSVVELRAIIERAEALPEDVELLVCPPFTLLPAFVAAATNTRVKIGAQDCHERAKGAHTGNVSAPMLRDVGCSHVIVGHSERRTDEGETDARVRAKAEAAHASGLVAIICIGETEAERDAGSTLEVIGRQLDASVPDRAGADDTVIAYEPVWAIGTGRTPTEEQVTEVHGFIRERLTARFGEAGAAMRVLYGGSVKPDNARSLLAVANVDGALVGGASLTAAQFLPIAEAVQV